MSEILGRLLEQEKWIEVEKDSMQSSNSEILATDCLGSCVGVAVYDSRNSWAYMLHASTVENDSLEETVETFADNISSIEGPFEVLAGGTMASQYNPISDEDFTGYARNVVEEKLEDRGINYRASWNDPPRFNRLAVSPDYGILYDVLE